MPMSTPRVSSKVHNPICKQIFCGDASDSSKSIIVYLYCATTALHSWLTTSVAQMAWFYHNDNSCWACQQRSSRICYCCTTSGTIPSCFTMSHHTKRTLPIEISWNPSPNIPSNLATQNMTLGSLVASINSWFFTIRTPTFTLSWLKKPEIAPVP